MEIKKKTKKKKKKRNCVSIILSSNRKKLKFLNLFNQFIDLKGELKNCNALSYKRLHLRYHVLLTKTFFFAISIA